MANLETKKDIKPIGTLKGNKPDGCMTTLIVCLIFAVAVIFWLGWAIYKCWGAK